jgi:hypothetical protein
MLAQSAIVLISGLHPENTFCLPPFARYWLFLVEAVIACAALLAAVSLFRKAYHSHQLSTASFLGSGLGDCGVSGLATWAIGVSWKSPKATAGSLSAEEKGRRLEWLFQDSHRIKEEDDRIRELILRDTGAWHCTLNVMPHVHPRELLDFETEA